MLGGGLPTSLTSELQVFCGLLGGLGCIRLHTCALANGRVLGCSGMWRAGLITRVSEVLGMATAAPCVASAINSLTFCCNASIWSALLP